MTEALYGEKVSICARYFEGASFNRDTSESERASHKVERRKNARRESYQSTRDTLSLDMDFQDLDNLLVHDNEIREVIALIDLKFPD